MYILYSVQAHGFLTNQATYSSNWKEARRMEKDLAFEIAKRHRHSAGYRMLPVRVKDLEALQ